MQKTSIFSYTTVSTSNLVKYYNNTRPYKIPNSWKRVWCNKVIQIKQMSENIMRSLKNKGTFQNHA